MLPHTNIGVLDRGDLARLREVTASQGLMLESVSERLMETVHAGSPTKHPAQRLATIEAAGELKIPFTSGILVGHRGDRGGAGCFLEALAELHGRHGHLQEVILQNFVAHPKYYGQKWPTSPMRRRGSGGGTAGVPSGAGLPSGSSPPGTGRGWRVWVASSRRRGPRRSLPIGPWPVSVDDIKRLI